MVCRFSDACFIVTSCCFSSTVLLSVFSFFPSFRGGIGLSLSMFDVTQVTVSLGLLTSQNVLAVLSPMDLHVFNIFLLYKKVKGLKCVF